MDYSFDKDIFATERVDSVDVEGGIPSSSDVATFCDVMHVTKCRDADDVIVGNQVSESDWEMFEGIAYGFDIVDTSVPGYDCPNYSSILVTPWGSGVGAPERAPW